MLLPTNLRSDFRLSNSDTYLTLAVVNTFENFLKVIELNFLGSFRFI